MNPNLLLAIPLLPLAAAVISGLFGRLIGRTASATLTIAGVLGALLLSLKVFQQLAFEGAPSYNDTVYTWLVSDGIRMQVGFLVDHLTVLMMVVVTFVSLCVHVYTIGYMHDDAGYQRFFSYISLFTFAMLMLVMSNNFMQLFFGWEAVGVVSYLLIGFWYTRPSATFANMKAYLVNRVGDFGFLLGIAGLWEWRPTGGTNDLPLLSFTMLTMNADNHPMMRRFHRPEDEKRMPVLLDPPQYSAWLQSTKEQFPDFLRAYPAQHLMSEAAPRVSSRAPAPRSKLVPQRALPPSLWESE
jgi:formate hydrogenlyase subunit 3/multisubunit Na+/H+ antiporter MnhD subunit